MFTNIIFPIEYRKYQQDMLETFEHLLNKNERQLHFVAPPGSRKTILGLDLIRRLNQQAVVFSPNSAIQIQWLDKLKALTNEMSISTDPFSEADIISLTYQAVAVKNHKTGELHDNAKNIIKHLKQHYPCNVLDECHHLGSGLYHRTN